MADRILKNVDGHIWKNTDGKILKDRPFSETPVQDGLVFWGNSQIENLTVVDGLVSEAYDIRDTGHTGDKMVQSVVSLRPTLEEDILNFGFKDLLSLGGQDAKSFFIVIERVSTTSGVAGVGIYPTGIGLLDNTSIGSYSGACYVNATKQLTPVFVNENQLTTLSSLVEIPSTGTINLGYLGGNYCYCRITEWGWYDRALSEKEVIYNQNAMNAKYNIF